MVILTTLPPAAQGTPVPTYNRYYMVIFPKITAAAQYTPDHTRLAIIWPYSQNYHQLPKVPQWHPKIGIIWSFFQKHQQLPHVPEISKYPQNTIHVSQEHNERNDETDVRRDGNQRLFSSTRPDSS